MRLYFAALSALIDWHNLTGDRKLGKTMRDAALTAAIHDWLADLERDGKSPRTLQTYAEDLRDFIAWYEDAYGEPLDVSAVLPRDIEDYKAFLQTTRRAAPRTINHRLAALSRLFKWAAGQGLVVRDPTANVRALRLPPRRPKALTPQEERRLRRAVYKEDDVRDIAIVEVFLGTGIRVGELLALRRGDLLVSDTSGMLIVRRGKWGNPRRIPLRTGVRQAVQSYLDSLAQNQQDDAPLWHGTRGPLKDPSGINRLLSKYARLANIPEVTPHTLRHTFATRYLEANPGDLRGLASLLGHTSLNTVMIYTEPTEDDMLRRIERMDGGGA